MTALLVVAAVSCGLQEALNPTATCEGREPRTSWSLWCDTLVAQLADNGFGTGRRRCRDSGTRRPLTPGPHASTILSGIRSTEEP